MIPPDMPEPLELRSHRRRRLFPFALILVMVLAFNGVLLSVTEDGEWLLSFLPMAISLLSLFLSSILMVFALGGSTVVDTSGVTRRRGRSQEHVPWEQIERISYTPGPPGVGYKLVLFRKSKRPIVLAAQTLGVFARRAALTALLDPVYARAGADRQRVASRPVTSGARLVMLALDTFVLSVLGGITTFTLYLTSPPTQAWWPGRAEASALPDACLVFEKALIARLTPNATAPKRDPLPDNPRDRSCSWGTDAPAPEMSIRLELMERMTGSGGGASEKAHDFYAHRTEDDCPTRLSGVGDEACSSIDKDERVIRVGVVARKGNVLVTLRYHADRPAHEVTAETVGLTRAVFDRIRFE